MNKELSIPEKHQVVMPYLILRNATAFITFTMQVFGAKEVMKEMRDENTIKHAEIQIGGSTIMLADSTAEFSPHLAGLFVYVKDADSAFKQAIDLGAEVVLEVSDQPYGRSGGIKDPFGNTWWITSVF